MDWELLAFLSLLSEPRVKIKKNLKLRFGQLFVDKQQITAQ